MNTAKQHPSLIGVGVISVLTVLLVLCLSLFAALTLTSAKADQNLSQRNADQVTAYYAADAQAVALYEEFEAGTEPKLEATIPMTDNQSLYVHFERQADGSAAILAWRTVTEETASDDHLPVYGGGVSE